MHITLEELCAVGRAVLNIGKFEYACMKKQKARMRKQKEVHAEFNYSG
jgi:translation initiation factor IF-3